MSYRSFPCPKYSETQFRASFFDMPLFLHSSHDAFGVEEHTWLKYCGAYKNLTRGDKIPPEPTDVRGLVGRAKLAGTQVVDAAHILGLIGSKITTSNGIQSVDGETLRIIYEEIKALSDLGEDAQVQLLKVFVDSELLNGKLSSDIHFDKAFEEWKQRQLMLEAIEFAKEWGVNEAVLFKAIHAFTHAQPDVIPYRDELISQMDYGNARNQEASSVLMHKLKVSSLLPSWMSEVKYKYSH